MDDIRRDALQVITDSQVDKARKYINRRGGKRIDPKRLQKYEEILSPLLNEQSERAKHRIEYITSVLKRIFGEKDYKKYL